MQRWTVSPAARVEILDLLLEENHRRAESEQRSKHALERIEIPKEDGTLFA